MSDVDKEQEKWNNQKRMGKKKFILIYGVLLWGICGSLMYSILTIFFNPILEKYSFTQILIRFITYAVIFGLVGIVASVVQWNLKTKKFNKE